VIRKNKGHYLFTIKDNQKKVKREIARCLDLCAGTPRYQTATTHNKGRGRHETRMLHVVPASDKLKQHWPGIQQIGCIERTRQHLKTGKQTKEQAYFITSLKSSPSTLLDLNRRHWHIENTLHRQKDVTFKEDASTIKKGNTPQVMATFRNTALAFSKLFSPSLTRNIEYFQRSTKQLVKLLT